MLYLIKGYGKNGEILKIGFTEDWEKRKEGYITHQPDYELLGTREGDLNLETYFKRKLKKYKYKPRCEWMIYNDEIINLFKNHTPSEIELNRVLKKLSENPKTINYKIISPDKDDIIEFSHTWDLISVFGEKMNTACKFIKEKGEHYINYFPEPFRSYLLVLGADYITSVKCERGKILKAMEISKIFSKDELTDYIQKTIKIGEKKNKVEWKKIIGGIYKELGISKTPKATDLKEWFEVKIINVQNPETGKRDKGFEILSLKS